MKKILVMLIVCLSVLTLNGKSKRLSEEAPIAGSASEFVVDFLKSLHTISYEDAKKNFTQERVKTFRESSYNDLKKSGIKFDDQFKYNEYLEANSFVLVSLRYDRAKGTLSASYLVKKINGKWMFADKIADK
jgi:hypothetical protein